MRNRGMTVGLVLICLVVFFLVFMCVNDRKPKLDSLLGQIKHNGDALVVLSKIPDLKSVNIFYSQSGWTIEVDAHIFVTVNNLKSTEEFKRAIEKILIDLRNSY